MRNRLIAAAATVAFTAGVAVTTAAPAQASGWGTIKSASVGKYLSYSSFTRLGASFKPTPGVIYRYCVVGRGNTSANLQPTAFGTKVYFYTSNNVTRCSKSWRTPSGYGSYMYPTANKLTTSGYVYISKVYVQRYYSGAVPNPA